MQKRWLIKNLPDQSAISTLNEALQVEPTVSKLLLQRGIASFDEAQAFFRPQLNGIHDPFLMQDMQRAVDRVNEAMRSNEKIMLFGDYDVDGTTAVAVMWNVLTEHYAQIEFYIPDRYAEGYGVSKQGIDYAHTQGITLIIALDCGVKSVELVAYAKSIGIDFIVCDHHTPGDVLPDGIILDPKRSDCAYPYKELSGCGVGFKLLQALCAANHWDTANLFAQLDLLAISIGADIVPITGENRILCYHGLKQLNENPRPGIAEILRIAGKEFPLTLTNVVFIIAPRINAAGRIHTGKKAVRLMISTDRGELQEMAESIHADNEERRGLDQAITAEALEQIAQDVHFEGKRSTVVFREDWHKGVIGIVASRLIENHYRPTIVLTESNGKATGSARSIRGLDIHEALQQCTDLLEQFGGHAFAAGMTLPLENVEAFRERFEKVVNELLLPEMSVAEQTIDLDLQFSEIFLTGEKNGQIPKLKRILNQLEPHGPGNMKPVFVTRNVFAQQARLLKDVHLKVVLEQPGSSAAIEGIGFNMPDKYDLVQSGEPFDVLYTLETNRWNDKEILQLNIKDIRASL
jgi:single-stranded-DNA-specific exonuclease